MDVLVDLLPPSFSVKIEPSAKDNRHKQQGQHKASSNPTSVYKKAEVKSSIVTIVNAERRTGADRRADELNRGRWLESRDSIDRRANKLAIFVKV